MDPMTVVLFGTIGTLGGVVAYLFKCLQAAQQALLAEKDKRREEASEHEGVLRLLAEKLLSGNGGKKP